MKGRSSIQQLKSYYKHLFHLLEEPVPAGQEAYQEWVHQLRVTIKKLKATYLLLEKAYGLPHRKKLTAPAQKLFDKAAEVRELQLLLQKLQPAPASTTRHLHTRLKRANQALERYHTKVIPNLKHALDQTLKQAEKLHRSDKKAFFRQLLHHLVLDLHQPEKTNRLHDTRKQIKMLLHLKSLAPKRFSAIIPWKKLEQLATRIGDWHDEAVILQQVQGMQFKHTNALLWQQDMLQKIEAVEKRMLHSLQSDLQRHRIL